MKIDAAFLLTASITLFSIFWSPSLTTQQNSNNFLYDVGNYDTMFCIVKQVKLVNINSRFLQHFSRENCS